MTSGFQKIKNLFSKPPTTKLEGVDKKTSKFLQKAEIKWLRNEKSYLERMRKLLTPTEGAEDAEFDDSSSKTSTTSTSNLSNNFDSLEDNFAARNPEKNIAFALAAVENAITKSSNSTKPITEETRDSITNFIEKAISDFKGSDDFIKQTKNGKKITAQFLALLNQTKLLYDQNFNPLELFNSIQPDALPALDPENREQLTTTLTELKELTQAPKVYEKVSFTLSNGKKATTYIEVDKEGKPVLDEGESEIQSLIRRDEQRPEFKAMHIRYLLTQPPGTERTQALQAFGVSSIETVTAEEGLKVDEEGLKVDEEKLKKNPGTRTVQSPSLLDNITPPKEKQRAIQAQLKTLNINSHPERKLAAYIDLIAPLAEEVKGHGKVQTGKSSTSEILVAKRQEFYLKEYFGKTIEADFKRLKEEGKITSTSSKASLADKAIAVADALKGEEMERLQSFRPKIDELKHRAKPYITVEGTGLKEAFDNLEKTYADLKSAITENSSYEKIAMARQAFEAQTKTTISTILRMEALDKIEKLKTKINLLKEENLGLEEKCKNLEILEGLNLEEDPQTPELALNKEANLEDRVVALNKHKDLLMYTFDQLQAKNENMRAAIDKHIEENTVREDEEESAESIPQLTDDSSPTEERIPRQKALSELIQTRITKFNKLAANTEVRSKLPEESKGLIELMNKRIAEYQKKSSHTAKENKKMAQFLKSVIDLMKPKPTPTPQTPPRPTRPPIPPRRPTRGNNIKENSSFKEAARSPDNFVASNDFLTATDNYNGSLTSLILSFYPLEFSYIGENKTYSYTQWFNTIALLYDGFKTEGFENTHNSSNPYNEKIPSDLLKEYLTEKVKPNEATIKQALGNEKYNLVVAMLEDIIGRMESSSSST